MFVTLYRSREPYSQGYWYRWDRSVFSCRGMARLMRRPAPGEIVLGCVEHRTLRDAELSAGGLSHAQPVAQGETP